MLRSTFDDANALDKFSQTRSGPVLRTSARGGQWLRPIFAANKQPSGKTL
ncbi:hypothetical protein X771_29870 [Mesorhizobium sp. LSJC277A00]|nr:hypothetical protein X771_29870 [Mesorhizobium sp. LSJC277A00]